MIQSYDGKLHVVFCDVGQGDAALIRTPNRQEILIDGGPNNQVLECLDQYLPFWDRDLTTILLTHPHYDHFRGLIDVLGRYDVQMIGY
ncbi:MAG TPA: MBL fold metallo-hydrolase, partial [Candidatus Levybacteria bacterium]|nr:MBL fold metallo-hydrolase [Candidatus Levybacteria bacterium]